MPYSEILIKPMREDLTRLGVEETRSPEQVEQAISETKGTLLVVVNSVCGCAAGKARPGVALALQNEARPDRAITVFAGADIEATARARAYFAPYSKTAGSSSCSNATRSRTSSPSRSPTNSPKPSTASAHPPARPRHKRKDEG
jgi:putative YphP/YqiW family bacilliredoxin